MKETEQTHKEEKEERTIGGLGLECLEFFEEDFLCLRLRSALYSTSLYTFGSPKPSLTPQHHQWASVVKVAKVKSSWCDIFVPFWSEEVYDSFEEEEQAEVETEDRAEEQEAFNQPAECEWMAVTGKKSHTVTTITDCDSANARKHKKEQERSFAAEPEGDVAGQWQHSVWCCASA